MTTFTMHVRTELHRLGGSLPDRELERTTWKYASEGWIVPSYFYPTEMTFILVETTLCVLGLLSHCDDETTSNAM